MCEGKNAQKVVLRFLSEQLYSVYAALKFCSTGRQGVFCCAVRVDKRMDKLFPLFQPIQIYIYIYVAVGRTVTSSKNKSRLLKMAFALVCEFV